MRERVVSESEVRREALETFFFFYLFCYLYFFTCVRVIDAK